MKIAILGTGGIGGYFGGMLAHAGYDVKFIARGAHLRAMRARGLRIERSGNPPLVIAPTDATDDPAEIGQVDLVLHCVKTYDLVASIPQMQSLIGPNTAILSTQNGIEAPEILAQAFGKTAIIPGLVYSELAIKEPGVIFQGSLTPRIVFGEVDDTPSERTTTIAEIFTNADVVATVSSNIKSAIWSKFCFICAMSGVTALTRQPIGVLMSDEEVRILLRAAMAEVYQLGLASSVHFEQDPVEAAMSTAWQAHPDTKSSLLRDLERGRKLEIEELNGAAVRLGRRLGIPTPVNHTIYAALRVAQQQSSGDTAKVNEQ